MDCTINMNPICFCRREMRGVTWEGPSTASRPVIQFYRIPEDRPSFFPSTTSVSASGEKIWKLWQQTINKEGNPSEKTWGRTCNLISGETIWIQNFPIYENESCRSGEAQRFNSENIANFGRTILENYKIKQVYVNPKSPLGRLMIEKGLYCATGEESKKPQLDFESQQFITTLGKLNDIVAKTIPKEKVPKEKKDTPDTSKQSRWRRFSSIPVRGLLNAVANKILHPGRNVKVLASAVMIISLCAILFRYSPRKMTHF